jgi:chromosome segregation ATPase
MSDLQNKLLEQEDHLSKIEATLSERTTLLGKMIQQNQSYEDEIKEARLLVSELQEESNEYLFQKEENDTTISRLKKEMKKKNDEFVDTIQSEKKLRTLLETDLQDVTVVLEKEKNKTKQFVELERDNYCLKDKIQRQEAFMKKLIGKEKKGRSALERRSSSKNLAFDMVEMQQQKPPQQQQTPPRKSNSRSSLTSSDNQMMDVHHQSKSSLTSCDMAAAGIDMKNMDEMRSPPRMRARSSGIKLPEMRTPPRSSRSLLSSEVRSPAR